MKKRKTAGELLAELNADPAFRARQQEQEQARQKKVAEWRRAEAPLVAELREIGLDVQSAWDLYKVAPYSEAIPILLKHLQRPYPERVREGIARALEVPDARAHWDALVQLFEDEPNATMNISGVKWLLGHALAIAATDDVVDDVIRLLRDRKHGGDRTGLVEALGRSKHPRALEALMELRTDSELATEVQKAIKRLRRTKARATIQSDFVAKEAPGELSEVSMNFDLSLVSPFLQCVAKLVSGFGTAEIAKVTQLVKVLDADEEHELHFDVGHEGSAVPLHIRVFIDDVDAPDIYFLTSPKLAVELDDLMRNFSEEHGI